MAEQIGRPTDDEQKPPSWGAYSGDSQAGQNPAFGGNTTSIAGTASPTWSGGSTGTAEEAPSAPAAPAMPTTRLGAMQFGGSTAQQATKQPGSPQQFDFMSLFRMLFGG